jgi:ComF family protein
MRRQRASLRRFARNAQNHSKVQSPARSPARTAPIARFTLTLPSLPIVAAGSFAASFTTLTYGRQVHLRHLVGRWLRAALVDPRLRGRGFDVIVPVPLHPTRKRERGFNQASLLAELLSAQISIQSRPLLERIRYTTTQTALDRAERMENLHNAFRLRKNMNVRDLRVLLIDDVLTTGSTLSECARVLKDAGVISVHAATAARA